MDLLTKQPHPSPSHQHHHQPSCIHIFHTQTQHSSLPPLYITPSHQQPTTLRPSTLTKLTRALTTLGTPQSHTPFLNHDIVKLRRELESGMSRERRQAMQFYILGVRDPGKRAAAELYLARYKGFVVGVDGRLGFGIEEGKYGEGSEGGERSRARNGDGDVERADVSEERRRGRSLWERIAGCGVM
ncbi:hypothetical protein BKA64DRAFT_710977 [Cadophora sp. MPI-SDFR-AT-0126]|nr:hypothetical protein BKA64DRAFT_710977 [Leotiomycetes sp. MPI-SDFR-AT-0126]